MVPGPDGAARFQINDKQYAPEEISALLDDGRLTDAQGHTVNFRNTIIIMTSNIGSEYLLDGITSDGEIKPEAREAVLAALRQRFPPEFLNRLDDIVLFKPLTEPEIEQIVNLMAGGLRARLADRNMTLDLAEDARAFIARQGFDPVYGARPLRRYIAREVETPVARALVAGDVRDGAVIRVGLHRRQAGHQLRQPTLTARYCAVPFPPGPRRTRVSPGWGSGGREVVTGIRVPSGLIRNNRSVAGGITPSEDWVVMRAPAV